MSSSHQSCLHQPVALPLHPVEYWRNTVRVLVFMNLFLVAAASAILLQSHLSAPWNWLSTIPFYLLAGASLHGVSLFAHEAVHGTLASNSVWNRV
ncbi:MAG TPA: hypothetical protein VMZ27_12170, partial [Candidatus Saccharimonadales bacterium]|nr:hypothetical protein [Candidatus Saccharimonadales bacterium]